MKLEPNTRVVLARSYSYGKNHNYKHCEPWIGKTATVKRADLYAVHLSWDDEDLYRDTVWSAWCFEPGELFDIIDDADAVDWSELELM